ncbi:hypothetical protein B0H17DRAFT_1126491 [Mycena rosella]|uniref:Uncharacterized protein n=1 Tax=Mycena rosella TaxID=1033263 RepID=A0AAD7GTD1_MYCRO|nr:hypothetical protein B0H17DRAFT_1126491 [Mycena rosella]
MSTNSMPVDWPDFEPKYCFTADCSFVSLKFWSSASRLSPLVLGWKTIQISRRRGSWSQSSANHAAGLSDGESEFGAGEELDSGGGYEYDAGDSLRSLRIPTQTYTDLHRPTHRAIRVIVGPCSLILNRCYNSWRTLNSTSINIKPLGAADHWRAAHANWSSFNLFSKKFDPVSMKVDANHVVACLVWDGPRG